MFDTYRTGPLHVYSTSTSTITEKRAPTDESLKLLEEMRNKAFNSLIVEAIENGNILRGVVVRKFPDNTLHQETICIAFKLNSEEYSFEIPFDSKHHLSVGDAVHFLIDAISQRIACLLIGKVFSK